MDPGLASLSRHRGFELQTIVSQCDGSKDVKSGTRLFEQPPKSDEHSDAERQWDDQVIFPTVGHLGLLHALIEPRNNRADSEALKRARSISTRGEAREDERRRKRGDGTGRCLVGGRNWSKRHSPSCASSQAAARSGDPRPSSRVSSLEHFHGLWRYPELSR